MQELEELDRHPDKQELLREVAIQLEKDLNRSGIKTNWREDELADSRMLVENLHIILQELYATDRQKLSAIMYTVDLSEKQISRQINRPNAGEMPDELAVLILKRVLQKVVLRRYYKRLG